MNECLNLKILGYFGHYNLGDEQYKKSFVTLFTKYIPKDIEYKIEFIDCDLIINYQFEDNDLIILGGGDVLNDYFLDKIIDKFGNKNNKIYAISVGLPYTETLISNNKLNIIDYIFIRTSVDLELFKKFFDENKICYIPDISLILSKETLNTQEQALIKNNNYYLSRIIDSRRKKVCISLSRHIYNKNYQNEYNNIIENMAKFLEYLVNSNYHIIFLPFNTNIDNQDENDILIHKDLLNFMLKHTSVTLTNITFIDSTLSVYEVLYLLSFVDLYLPMRFHACLFSIYSKIPFIPIYTTRKVDNLLKEINWEYSYKLKCNELDLPLELDYNYLRNIYENLTNDKYFKQKIYNKLLYVTMNKFFISLNEGMKKFVYLLSMPKKEKSKDVFNKTDKKIKYIYDSVQSFAKSKGYVDFRKVDNNSLQDIIISVVSYNLTDGSIDSCYNYGLKEKMFREIYNYEEEWRWILHDFHTNKSKNLISNPNGIFNIGYIDQRDYSGCHRFGWEYVYENIKYLHNEKSSLLLDMYVDRTFHWNKDVNKLLNIIPYRKSWTGFIHHTYDTEFSSYNSKVLFESEEFIESLKYCKGLLVLSKYLKYQMEQSLISIGMENIPVYNIVHPTEDNVPKFSFKNFLKNNDKLLLHVGGWMRNVYSFYNLPIRKHIKNNYRLLCGDLEYLSFRKEKIKLRKVALKGKHMNNYYPYDNFKHDLKYILSKNEHSEHDNDDCNCPNCSHDHGGHNKPNCSHDGGNHPNCSHHHHHCHCHHCHCHTPNCSYHDHHSEHSSSSEHHSNSEHYNEHHSNYEQYKEHYNDNEYCNCSEESHCSEDSNCSEESHCNRITNNWYKHFYSDINDKLNSVEIIDYVSNDKYDQLLTENIVFINLVDASAINTLIECMVRNLPIVINNHPSVIELLGENYPLYYNSKDYFNINMEVYELLKDTSKIRAAYYYLMRLNKKQLNIKYFTSNFIKIINQIK